jgi:NAD(P)-dependent dehydrogenase (short-subunit alcohol dehydrogenase family)
MGSRFTGKVVVVAGGTGGLGRALSLGFLEEGARAIVTYRKQEEFIGLKNAANAHAGRLEGQVVDVTDEDAVARMIDEVIRQHGRLDALVNAAGGYAGGVNLWEAESKVLEQMLALNLRSGYALARAAVRAMLKQGHGSIVNVAAKAAFDHFPGAGAYVASKAAAVAMLDSLAAEVKGSGVRVNSVLPSIIDTEANRKAMPDANFAKWPKPADIARVILFLCSDDAKVIHGASIPVYGDS